MWAKIQPQMIILPIKFWGFLRLSGGLSVIVLK